MKDLIRTNKHILQLRYALSLFAFMPVTFVKRVIFGSDPYWKLFFWNRWGFLPKKLIQLACQGKTIWVIASSGGELIQATSFLKKIKREFPEYNLVLSTESYDSFQYAQNLEDVDFVFIPPWDLSFICNRVLNKIRPSMVIFIEHCYYPALSREAKRLKIRTLMCSGAINFQFLKGYFLMQRNFILQFYKFIDKLAVKSKDDFENLRSLGVGPERMHILGDMRFDTEHLRLNEEDKERLRTSLRLSKSDSVFVVGSIHKEEVDLVLNAFRLARRSYPKLKLILTPRWVNDVLFIENRIGEFSYNFIRHTQLDSCGCNAYDILIIDTFGELPRIYGIASVVFIASSLVPINVRRLGHNIFEPLAHGVPVLFGPNMTLWRKFADSLKETWPQSEVKDAPSLAQAMCKILGNENLKRELRDCALRLTRANDGITQRYVELVQNYITSSKSGG